VSARPSSIKFSRDRELHTPPVRFHTQYEYSWELLHVGLAFDNRSRTLFGNFTWRWEYL